jgi:hypothetical protein
MSTMNNFYKLLNMPSESKNLYIDALADLTQVGRSQLSALASNLEWQEWGSQPVELTKA